MTLSYIKLISSAITFGTIGLFVQKIPMGSVELGFIRTLIGAVFLTFLSIITKEKLNKEKLKNNLLFMVLAGFCQGLSCMFYFESYKNTTVSVTTITYYTAPILVLLIPTFVLDEKLTNKKITGILLAMLGMILVNGTGTLGGSNPRMGVIYGFLAALTYALSTVLNKKIKGISNLVLTTIQTYAAALIIGVFFLLVKTGPINIPSGRPFVYLIIISLFHSGITLYHWLSAIQELPTQTVALLSYLDPLSAIVFSTVLFGERLVSIQILGLLLILGGSAYGEMRQIKTNRIEI